MHAYIRVHILTTRKKKSTQHRFSLGATCFGGRLWVAGGYRNSKLSSMESFDIEQGTWIVHADMNAGRSDHALCAAMGTLYAVGGQSERVEAFDVVKGVWSDVAALPYARHRCVYACMH